MYLRFISLITSLKQKMCISECVGKLSGRIHRRTAYKHRYNNWKIEEVPCKLMVSTAVHMDLKRRSMMSTVKYLICTYSNTVATVIK